MAYQEREMPMLGWLGGSQLRNLTFMHDHFYKVLWKLLMQADREGAAREHEGNTKAAKGKKGFALAVAGIAGRGRRVHDGLQLRDGIRHKLARKALSSSTAI